MSGFLVLNLFQSVFLLNLYKSFRMETVFRFNKKLSQKQMKMALDVLKAIGLTPIAEEKIVQLEEWQKSELSNRLKSIDSGNFKTTEQAHKMFDECFK